MLELMATCRISTAMHHSQREKLPERGGKTTPSACQPRPWGMLRSRAGRGRSRCRWAALAPALPGREAVCSEPDGLLCEGVSLGVLGIPLGCSPIAPGCSASLWTKPCHCIPPCSKGLSPQGLHPCCSPIPSPPFWGAIHLLVYLFLLFIPGG